MLAFTRTGSWSKHNNIAWQCACPHDPAKYHTDMEKEKHKSKLSNHQTRQLQLTNPICSSASRPVRAVTVPLGVRDRVVAGTKPAAQKPSRDQCRLGHYCSPRLALLCRDLAASVDVVQRDGSADLVLVLVLMIVIVILIVIVMRGGARMVVVVGHGP